jgi:acyl dehydratase
MDSTKVPLGSSSEVHHTYLDPDNVVAYALASNDANPLYLDGLAVPPLFAGAVAWPAFLALRTMPQEAEAGMTGSLQGEHDLCFRKPMVPGTWVHTVGEIWSVVCSSAGMNVVFRLTTTDDDGDQVVEQFLSRMVLGTVTGGDQGAPRAGHTFPEAARSRPVGSVRLPTTRDQPFRYAGASGDDGAMHLSDEAARAAGFPRKILQGLCTFATTTRGLVDLAAGGDPRRVRRVAVRFSAPFSPGEDIELTMYDGGGTEGCHAYVYEALSNGRTILRHGLLEVLEEPENRPNSTARLVL